MNQLLSWLSQVFSSWKFWIVIPPWDLGVRIRLGKHAKTLKPGPHFRIPFIDQITLVNTRTRVYTSPPISVDGASRGFVRTASATFTYRITDPEKALLAYTNVGPVLAAIAQSGLREGLGEDANLAALQAEVSGRGAEVDFICHTEQVEARAIKLLQSYGGLNMGGEDHSVFATGPMVSGQNRF